MDYSIQPAGEKVSIPLLTSAQIEEAFSERPLFDVPECDPDKFAKTENPSLSLADITLILDKHCRTNGPNGIETTLDASTLILIDAAIDYKLFIIGEDIYDWEGMYKYHPFVLMGIQPEAVTSRLYVDLRKTPEGEQLFVSTAANKTAKAAPTKIYKAGSEWKDFIATTKIYNLMARKMQTDQKMLALGMPIKSGLLQLK
jgi:hypothetical protein